MGNASEKSHFWEKTPGRLPEGFVYNKIRRWFKTFNYINQFRGSGLYLKNAMDWIMENVREDRVQDRGTQIKDPWRYFPVTEIANIIGLLTVTSKYLTF